MLALSSMPVPTGRRSAVSYTKLLFECLQKLLDSRDPSLCQVDSTLHKSINFIPYFSVFRAQHMYFYPFCKNIYNYRLYMCMYIVTQAVLWAMSALFEAFLLQNG